jgi:hypothetical protein
VGDAGLTAGSEEKEFAMVVRELSLDFMEVLVEVYLLAPLLSDRVNPRSKGKVKQ